MHHSSLAPHRTPKAGPMQALEKSGTADEAKIADQRRLTQVDCISMHQTPVHMKHCGRVLAAHMSAGVGASCSTSMHVLMHLWWVVQLQLHKIRQAAEEGQQPGSATRSWQETLKNVRERED